ncbi:SLAM family member 6-like [Megalobrama amblycephala]|uniref:SLAM family member 6-like n=1 Tax=Megalobrama amblycephala TaxID=75352 RepID=UPI0020140DE2|nr:SLAM family member 6-like [Megalobrama amblycephala]
MVLLLFILILLGGVSYTEAGGTKTASLKDRYPSKITDLQSLKITRHISSCSPSVSKCVLKCSAHNVSRSTLTWFKENQVCSQINVFELNPNPSLPLVVEYQDKNTYSCVLNSPISNQTEYANISQLCQPCPATTQTAVSVKEGDSVTLHTNSKYIEKETEITWRFGSNEILIAEVIENNGHIYDCDGLPFKDRLQLDSQTGDLTVRNTIKSDSGIFKLQINNISENCWNFNVTVSEPLPSPHISNHSTHCPSSGSECVLECSVENVTNVNLSWYKGNSLLSNISVSDVNYLCLNLDYKDNGNYSCVVSNSFINESKNLIISELCSEQSNNHILKICLGVLGALVVIVGVGFCLYKHRQTSQEEAGHQTATSQNSPPEAPNSATDSNDGNERQPLTHRLNTQSIPLCCR